MKLIMVSRLIRQNIAIISFVGGFGNNLFQIAAAHVMEQRGFTVRFEVSNVKRKRLEILEIPEISNFVRPKILRLSRYFPSIIGKRGKFTRFFMKKVLRIQPWIDLNSNGDLPAQLGQNYLITGYWQRLSIAENLPASHYFKIDTVGRKVAVHVRRGDMYSNIQNPMDDYFRNCVKTILKDNLDSNFNFFVYTDDPVYCLNHLDLGVEFEVVLRGSTLEDFVGLIEAEYLVMSRSTYSWWAGFFSNGQVFAPSPWENSQVESVQLSCPEDWIKISCR